MACKASRIRWGANMGLKLGTTVTPMTDYDERRLCLLFLEAPVMGGDCGSYDGRQVLCTSWQEKLSSTTFSRVQSLWNHLLQSQPIHSVVVDPSRGRRTGSYWPHMAHTQVSMFSMSCWPELVRRTRGDPAPRLLARPLEARPPRVRPRPPLEPPTSPRLSFAGAWWCWWR